MKSNKKTKLNRIKLFSYKLFHPSIHPSIHLFFHPFTHSSIQQISTAELKYAVSCVKCWGCNGDQDKHDFFLHRAPDSVGACGKRQTLNRRNTCLRRRGEGHMARVANLVCRSREFPWGGDVYTWRSWSWPKKYQKLIPRKAAVSVKVLGETDHSLFQELKVV